jgi:chemotaxis protein methyltransferase CheR
VSSDTDCTVFLQWALPLRNLRWPGFRKVRRQVCKRLKRRIEELGLVDFAAYRARLEADASEWGVFDECCHITISRFFRDRGVFEALRQRVLPDIATRARSERQTARIWSAGCASGEGPYT